MKVRVALISVFNYRFRVFALMEIGASTIPHSNDICAIYVPVPFEYHNKKLRYCEEHSASVVLIGVLDDIYRETINISTANQPLLRNWPQKPSNSAK